LEKDMRVLRGFATTKNWGQAHYYTAGSGKPVLLVHQSPGPGRTMLPLLQHVAQHRQAYALDTIGYGDSDRPSSPPSLSDYADSFIEVIEALGHGPVPVHGNHTGGCIAILAAQKRPDLISALSLGAIAYFDASELAGWRARMGIAAGPEEFYKEDGSHLLAPFEAARKAGASLEEATLRVMDRAKTATSGSWGLRAVFDAELTDALRGLRGKTQVLINPTDQIKPNTERALELLQDYEYKVADEGEDLAAFFGSNLVRFLNERGI
jgi:pimeloyl-ACP methyl ester carboxylesterase